MVACKIGIINPKKIRKGPALVRSPNFLPVTKPTSKRNKVKTPLKGVSKRGATCSKPFLPEKKPIRSPPTSRTVPLPANNS